MTSPDFFRGAVTLSARGRTEEGPFPVTIDGLAEHLDLALASTAARLFLGRPYSASGQLSRVTFKGTIDSADSISGSASLVGEGISVADAGSRTLLKDMLVRSDISLKGKDLEFRGDASAGSMNAAISGTVERFAGPDRSLHLNMTVPEVKAGDIRAAFWDIIPDRLLYAGLEGSIALNFLAVIKGDFVTADGTVLVKDIAVEGENGEYSVGPVNGTLPFHYRSKDENVPSALPSFERADFDKTKKAFAESKQYSGNEFRIGSIRYGFRLLEDVSLWIEQNGRTLNISRLSAKMFGGRVFGAASVDLSGGPAYRAGVLVDGISLTRLCEDIPPIKGYISGRVDGIAVLKGSGAGLAKMTGMADFWTYSDREEKTRISREFLEKIGGPQVRAYLGERRFSKGVMSLFIQNGFFIFRELEISNRNLFGITDLSVKVAPLNNRIAIDHLMWTITEAAQRAKSDK
jgi:hypothetical protein